MTEDDLQQDERRDRPVLAGLGALVAVALVVGLVLGGGALVATRVLGLSGGDDEATSGATARETLFLPAPEETDDTDGPGISIAPDTAGPSTIPPVTPTPDTEITLEAAQESVGPMDQIDLSGTYPDGEGAVLQVQKFENDAWGDFPVTISIGGDDFATFIQTGSIGLNRFRVLDTDTGETSNEVEVEIVG